MPLPPRRPSTPPLLHCAALLCMGAVLGVSPQVSAKKVAPAKSVSIAMVGDVGLNRSNLKVDARGIAEGRGFLSWTELSSKIASLIDGNFNFMNLETVVTDRNDLRPGDKRQSTPFLFRTHPIGVAHLLDLGFNLVSGANNHAYDYGEQGVRETVSHLKRLASSRPGTLVTGIGLSDDEAVKPLSRSYRGMSLGFSSIGIVTNSLTFHRAGPNKPGTMAFRNASDWKRSVDELVATKNDLKVLSVHYGTERDIRTDARSRDAYRAAIDQGVDIIIGHHAHVVRGVELRNGKPIFYGLGNFLIRGAANMGKKPELRTCCDYGLLAKTWFARSSDGDYKLAAIEVVPIFDMHRIARPLEPAEASKRIEVLNVLAEELDDEANGSKGVRFQARKDGSGLFCTGAAAQASADIQALCRNFKSPIAASSEVRQRVKSAPSPGRNRGVLKKRKQGKKTKASKRRNKKR